MSLVPFEGMLIFPRMETVIESGERMWMQPVGSDMAGFLCFYMVKDMHLLYCRSLKRACSLRSRYGIQNSF